MNIHVHVTVHTTTYHTYIRPFQMVVQFLVRVSPKSTCGRMCLMQYIQCTIMSKDQNLTWAVDQKPDYHLERPNMHIIVTSHVVCYCCYICMNDKLTGMDKALEVDLVAVWVGAGSDVEGRHVATLKGLSDGLHISDQMRVVCSHDLVPGHHGTIVMLMKSGRVAGGRKEERKRGKEKERRRKIK